MEWFQADSGRRSMEPPLWFDPWLTAAAALFSILCEENCNKQHSKSCALLFSSLWRSIPLLSMLLPENNASTGLWCLVTKQYISNNTQRHNCQKKFWIAITPFSKKLKQKGDKKRGSNAAMGKIEKVDQD